MPANEVIKMQNNGKLVVFEGIDHVGKSTICELIIKSFVRQGMACSMHSFPGKQDGTLGKLVYDIHHDKEGIFAGNLEINSSNIDSLSLQIMHVAAHIDLLNKKIIPDIETGKIVCSIVHGGQHLLMVLRTDCLKIL